MLYFLERGKEKMSDPERVAHLPSAMSLSFLTALFSFGIVVGIMRVQLVEEVYPYVCESACTFTARVISTPETKDVHQTFRVTPLTQDGEEDKSIQDVLVRVPIYPRYQIGDTLSLSGVLRLPDVIMPHGENNAFDYKSYLSTKHVGSVMYYPSVEVVDAGAHDVRSILGRVQVDMVSRLTMYVSQPASTLASGMLFGASSMSKELTDAFRTAGLSHIIVLSGFNIAIVISFILLVCSFLPLVFRIAFASTSVVLFVIMVGGEASVVRATLMAFVALLATLLGRQYVAHQALIISLLAIVMYVPQSLIYDVSLHLSFLATAGLVYFSPVLQNYLINIKSKSLGELVVTTASAYVFTLPYIMYTFGTVSLYALLANIIVVPLVPLAMLLSFLVVGVSYISTHIVLFIGLVDSLLLNLIIYVSHVVGELPLASIKLSLSSSGAIVMYIFLICFTGYLYQHHLRKEDSETHATNNKNTSLNDSNTIISGIIRF
jgi:competence protein ComEC